MSSVIKLTAIAILLFIFTGCSNLQEQKNEQPYLIVLSMDGFRWDYPDKATTPTLDSLAKVGTKAESIKPCFPTKTFPNHYAIATGLYPDNHGLVLNDFTAVDLNTSYQVRKREAVQNGVFYKGTPIWNAAEKQGIKAATLFWVGSSADIQGIRPSIWSPYNEQLSQEARIDSIVMWLKKPEPEKPHLILWYYHEPDGIGHMVGPEGKEIVPAIENLDKFLGNFFTAMRKLPDFNKYNFIITSDHGMGQISDEKLINLDNIVDTSNIEYIDGSNPIFNIKVKDGSVPLFLKDGFNLASCSIVIPILGCSSTSNLLSPFFDFRTTGIISFLNFMF